VAADLRPVDREHAAGQQIVTAASALGWNLGWDESSSPRSLATSGHAPRCAYVWRRPFSQKPTDRLPNVPPTLCRQCDRLCAMTHG